LKGPVSEETKGDDLMDEISRRVTESLSNEDLDNLSQQIGADRSATSQALSAVVPLLVSALANNASQPSGAQALQQALVNDHSGSILNNVAGHLSNPQAANGAGILQHILGGQRPQIEQGLAQSSGMDSGSMGQLMEIAAPLVMGALGQQQQQQSFDVGGLAGFLGQQQQQVQQDSPDLMGLISNFLDMNRDGSAIDDVLKLAANFFFSKRS
jgi:hypothetical protein